MSFQRLFERYQADLDQARKRMERTRLVEDDLRIADSARMRLVEETKRRIERLEADRTILVERIDAEIRAEKEVLKALEEAERPGPRPEPTDKPKEPDRPSGPRAGPGDLARG